MNPRGTVDNWWGVNLSEQAAAQSQFTDPRSLLRQSGSIFAGPKGEWFIPEKETREASGGPDWTDAWRLDCFDLGCNRRVSDLAPARRQLPKYFGTLEKLPAVDPLSAHREPGDRRGHDPDPTEARLRH